MTSLLIRKNRQSAKLHQDAAGYRPAISSPITTTEMPLRRRDVSMLCFFVKEMLNRFLLWYNEKDRRAEVQENFDKFRCMLCHPRWG